MTNTAPIRISGANIGRIKGEGWVKIDMRLAWNERETQTVDHETVSGYWTLSISATLWQRSNSPDCYAAGQCIDDVARLDTPLARRIVKVWREWHLNDLNTRCVHQGGTGAWQPNELPCPETGYLSGSAWLLRPIPADVLAEIASIAEEIDNL